MYLANLFFPCCSCGDPTLVLTEDGYACVDPECPSNQPVTEVLYDVCCACCKPMTPRRASTCGCEDDKA
jgi:hypothetical protein